MIFILIPIISGIFGAILASGRERNPFGWFLLCFFLPLIGHVLLAVLPSEAQAERPAATHVTPQPLQIGHSNVLPVAHSEVAEAKSFTAAMSVLPQVTPAERWHYLIEYDPLLREAAEQLAPLGPQAIEKLRDAYLALQDRSLVPNIVARIHEKHVIRVPATAPSIPTPTHDQPPVATVIEPVHRAAPLRSVAQFMPSTAARLVPRHTTVTPQDLESAEYVETHRGVHLYRLNDGRVYIDGHMAVVSLDAARGLVNQAAHATDAREAAPTMQLHS